MCEKKVDNEHHGIIGNKGPIDPGSPDFDTLMDEMIGANRESTRANDGEER